MKQQLEAKFYELFGQEKKASIFFAPGRVNLIGEHTDYNGGHVFPCALTIGTYAVARKRNDRKLCFYSTNFEQLGVIESSLDDLVYRKEDNWTNYSKGVLWAFREKGYEMDGGLDILVCGTIPNGSGLSSSASLEVLTGFVLKKLFGFQVSFIDLAILGQIAENQFIGVNCGIMDQFAIAMGKKDQAIFLDTAELTYEYAPIQLEGIKIVIMNTNKKRGLHDSKYNERRNECEVALQQLQQVIPIESLGQLTEEQFEEHKLAIESDVCRKRAKHAVYENQRTLRAVEALKENNLTLFGELMIASHASLRDDYEVTGIELDTLVDAALQCEGVIGARMTGAGFGGCAVSLVEEDVVGEVIQQIGSMYEDKIGYAAEFYVVEVGNGPMVLE